MKYANARKLDRKFWENGISNRIIVGFLAGKPRNTAIDLNMTMRGSYSGMVKMPVVVRCCFPTLLRVEKLKAKVCAGRRSSFTMTAGK
jgi:hypothetical protein